MEKRIKQDDFVVDDDGQGYLENGMEIWDEPEYSSGNEVENEIGGDEPSIKKQSKAAAFFKEQNAKISMASWATHSSALKKEDYAKIDSTFDHLISSLDDAVSPPKPKESNSFQAAPSLTGFMEKPALIKSEIAFESPLDDSFDAFDDTQVYGDQEKLQETTELQEKKPGASTILFKDSIKTGRSSMNPKIKLEFAPSDSSEFITQSTPKPFLPQNFASIPQAACLEPEMQTQVSINGNVNEFLSVSGKLLFFWFDAYERKDGSLFLFGKIKHLQSDAYFSCCLCISSLKRNLFFLPRDSDMASQKEVSFLDLHSEVSNLCKKYKISKFAAKKVSRKYAFEVPNVPFEADYLKLVYDFSFPAIPDCNGNTFSAVFGATSSSLELFLLKRKIMGPCWLEISDARFIKKNISWCKFELECDNSKLILPSKEEIPAPLFTIVSISLKTNLVQQTNEIIAASAVVFKNVPIDSPMTETCCSNAFNCMRQLDSHPFPLKLPEAAAANGVKAEFMKNERSLLNFFIAAIHKSDPDIIVGHNFFGFDLDVLLNRMKTLKIDFWSRLGRLVWNQWPKLGAGESKYNERAILSGRLVCDTFLSAKELVKSKNYSLETLVQSQLNEIRPQFHRENILEYMTDARGFCYIMNHTEKDALLSALLAFKLVVLPLSKQLTNVAGNLWSKTLLGSRAERNEYLLLHEFHNAKFIVPDKTYKEESEPLHKGKKKPGYAGGLVLEPKKGFYDKFILLLDFNSLYPSIIQEYNICFTTVERSADDDGSVPPIPDASMEQGILPRILGTLVQRRRQVKGLMRDPKLSKLELIQLDTRQKALKLTANSMYGCLGFSHSRFYAKPLATLITFKGREILQNTVDLAQNNLNLQVIYGDTDSIMINTGTNDLLEAKKIGQTLKKSVNERSKLLEIEMDGIFKKLLLLKKKKYAALVVNETADGNYTTFTETKGLDMVRRDWCGLAVEMSEFILSQVLSDNPREEVVDQIHRKLTLLGSDIREGRVPIEKFIISKNLTKNVEEYSDAKSQPHVQVAVKMISKGIRCRIGDTIPYVICQNDQQGSIAMRAFHPDELNTLNPSPSIDFEWYLAQQVHPPISRLCQYIDGTDSGRIADCLGLDSRKFSKNDETQYSLSISDSEKFTAVQKWSPICHICKQSSVFEGIRVKDGSLTSGFRCPICSTEMPSKYLYNQLNREIRQHIRQYYDCVIKCDDKTCGLATRRMSIYHHRCLTAGCKGSMNLEVSNKAIYTQLLYYSSLFDQVKLKKKYKPLSAEAEQAISILESYKNDFDLLSQIAAKYFEQCAFPVIDLAAIFGEIPTK